MARKPKRKKQHRFFWFFIKLQIILMLLVMGGMGYYYYGGYASQVEALHKQAEELVEAADEQTFVPSRTSFAYDVNGELISERSANRDAEYISYDQIPAKFVTTIISIEDKKFYSHNGVDIRAVFRAVKAMIENGKATQGGSTITMQLAKLIFMESGRTWQYKVEQMFIATELEKRYTKSQILEYYLNNIYFANGYYGIGAACHGYFNCDIEDLDVSQIAFLLAIPNSPTYYDPITNMKNTIDRRNLILRNLLDDGKISDSAYMEAISEKIVLNIPQKTSGKWNNYVDTYTYHCATKALMENKGFAFQYYFASEQDKKEYQEDYDELYAACQKEIFAGGYEIYTSIDMEKQRLLQEAVDQELAEFTTVSEEGVYEMQGSAVCIDNDTGYVVAIVGGRSQNFSSYTLNRAYQSHRQPGSSIKPLLVYTPLFERGYTPETKVVDEEIEGGPKNASGTYKGEVDIRYAVSHSLNTVAWQLYDILSPQVGLKYLKKMNFSAIVDEDYVLATAVGGFTNGMSALEMTAGFATLENDGLYRNPTCIKKIVDARGNVVYQSQQTQTVIYGETAARIMTDVLRTVMTDGTGKSALLETMPCAGKTGTTNNMKDGWFVGYTNYYTTGVWIGYDMPKEIPDLSEKRYPATIWKNYMDKIHEGLQIREFLPYAQLSEEFRQKLNLEELEEERRRVGENAQIVDTDGDGIVDAVIIVNPEPMEEPEAEIPPEAQPEAEIPPEAQPGAEIPPEEQPGLQP